MLALDHLDGIPHRPASREGGAQLRVDFIDEWRVGGRGAGGGFAYCEANGKRESAMEERVLDAGQVEDLLSLSFNLGFDGGFFRRTLPTMVSFLEASFTALAGSTRLYSAPDAAEARIARLAVVVEWRG